jgi:phosphoribosyl-AMP cyclohydrolase
MSQMDLEQLEEGTELCLDFEKIRHVAQASEAVLPVVVQDIDTKQVLMLAYANQQALLYALAHNVAAFWSTSRDELWIKGATSGDTLELVETYVNCEQNSLLYLVRPLGNGACHTKGPYGTARKSCYYRRIDQGKLVKINDEEKGQ